MDTPEVEFDDAGPSAKQLASLSALAERALAQEAEVVRLTGELRDAITAHSMTVEKDIPEAMADAKMSEFKLLNGQRVTVQERFIGNKLTDEEGLAWVEAHEGVDSIKTEIVLELPKGEMETAQRIYQLLKEDRAANRFVKLTLDRYVHNATIGAFAKSRVEAGDAPPLDKLGVVRKKSAKIGRFARTTTAELKGLDYK